MEPMRLFRRRLPDAALLDDLAEHLRSTRRDLQGRYLAHASGEQLTVVALTDLFALRDADGWRTWAWQQVQEGRWTGETATLGVRLLDGERLRFELADAGDLPSVFVERVQSSILVEERVRVPGGEVIVSGRRPPAGVPASVLGAPIVWHALALGRVDLEAPGVSDAVVRATNRLRSDYEM